MPTCPRGRQAGSSPHTTLLFIRPALTFIGQFSLTCSQTNIQSISICLLVPLPRDEWARTIKTSPRLFTITNSFLRAQCGGRTWHSHKFRALNHNRSNRRQKFLISFSLYSHSILDSASIYFCRVRAETQGLWYVWQALWYAVSSQLKLIY